MTQRTREIGVRLALGADRARVLRMFVGQGLVTAMVGIALGLPAALLLSRLMKDLLFQVTASDPVALAAVLGTLLVVTLGASYLPARRAARIEPTMALRE